MVAFTWHQLDLSARVYTFYFFWRDFFTIGVTLVFIWVSGATFFTRRDFS